MEEIKCLEDTELLAGDILLYKPLPVDFSSFTATINTLISKLITFSTWSKYNHASMVISPREFLKSVVIVEAHAETGVAKKVLSPKWYPNILVIRPNRETNFSASLTAVAWWKDRIGCKYDFITAFLSGIFAFFRVFRFVPLPLDNKTKFFCSNGLAEAYNNYGHGIKVSKAHPSQCTPGDLYRFRKNAATYFTLKGVE